MKKINLVFFISVFTIISLCEHIQFRIRRGEIPMRGVNLGGWLVAEYWMTKSSVIWQGVPEYIANKGQFNTMKYLNHTIGDPRFQQHWKTWITEQDIKQISDAGLNTVRVPVGFWIVGFDNFDPSNKQQWKVFAPGALKYLDTLIRTWALKYNVAVLISIHAAKGSQNGYDHSAPPDYGVSYWGSYPQNINNTINAAEFLSNRYKKQQSFLGIGLLNEPGGTTGNETLKKYYIDCYNKLRKNASTILLTHAPLIWEQNRYHWSDFTPPPVYKGFLHEWHKYLIWGFEGWDADRLIRQGISSIKDDIQNWRGNPLFIGQWSVASNMRINDENKFREFVRLYFTSLKNAKGGYTYWSWKTSDDLDGTRREWSFRNLYRSGYILKSYYKV